MDFGIDLNAMGERMISFVVIIFSVGVAVLIIAQWRGARSAEKRNRSLWRDR